MNSHGRVPAEREVLERFWKGQQIVEADFDIYLYANREDASKATPKDPEQCVLAQAAKRLFDSRAVAVFRTVAYMDLALEEGRQLYRFEVPRKTRDALIKYDRTGEFPPNGFLFRAIPQWKTLARQRESFRRRSSGSKQKKRRSPATRTRGETPFTFEDVRSGQGAVQSSSQRYEIKRQG
jgi:hypothetical protein